MKHKPILDLIVVKRDPPKEIRTAGGIILDGDIEPAKKELMVNYGTVLAVGAEAYFESTNAGFEQPVHVGDHVSFKVHAGLLIKHDLDGEEPPMYPNCVLLKDRDILSVEEKQ